MTVQVAPPPAVGTSQDVRAHAERESGWLVECHQRVVLVEHRRDRQGARGSRCTSGGGRRRADGRDPQFVADRKACVRSHPPPVAPHFAAAQDAVNVAFRDALQQFLQEVVDPLPIAVFPNYNPVHGILA